MSLIPRLPLFAAAFTLLSLTLALVFLSGQPVPAAQAQTTPTTTTTVDYDSNDDRLIEISNLAQLNAVRWDLDGDGAVAAADQANYTAAFTNAAAGMGCPDGSDADTNPDPCLGYELKADLTFDTNGDGSITAADSAGLYWNNGAGWTPIGDARRYTYTGQFQGRGKTISHLFINNSSALYVGLFGAVGSGGRITGVGLTEVSLASSRPAVAGSLVGSNAGTVTASYATGTVNINVGGVTNANSIAGGLTGHNTLTGAAQASFANVTVSATHSSASAIIGGLTGQNEGNLRASYATGAVVVTGNTRFTKAGGLAGNNGGTITASYARGRVTATGSGAAAGGLVGGNLRNGRVVASYWDTTTSGQTGSAGGTGQTTNALQTPSGYNYSGIYAGWNLNLDGAAGGDSPWYFGGANQYPLLDYGTLIAAPQRDYDADNDRLIEVNNLAQLNAIRWDRNAPWEVDADGIVAAADQDKYDAAFPGAIAGMGCAQGATAAVCTGYELMSDLDFDTDGDGSVDADDEFWNNGQGWNPIGGSLTGTLQGNGKTIANLYINYTHSGAVDRGASLGLFESVGHAGIIDGINLWKVNIRTQSSAVMGALAGNSSGTIRGSSASGILNSNVANLLSSVRVSATTTASVKANAGGLVGYNFGSIASSHAKVGIVGNARLVGSLAAENGCLRFADGTVKCGSIASSYSSSWAVSTTFSNPSRSATALRAHVGGLVGENNGTIAASYSYSSTVNATGNRAYVGGLAGSNSGTITASYSRSPVKATGNNAVVGGLVGYNQRVRESSITLPGAIIASYAIGPVVATGTNPSVGGLVGNAGSLDSSGQEIANSKGTAVDSYWDIGVSGQSSSALGTGMRGTGPTSYTGIFANWNLNLDGVAGNDDPWHFASRQYPILKYGGLDVRNQLQLYIPDVPAVGETARISWPVGGLLTESPGQEFIWERSADGVTGWTVIRSRPAGIGGNRYDNGASRLLIEPYEANQRFRVRGLSNERSWIPSYISQPARAWSGPTAALTFASGHTNPRVGQAIAISGSDNVRWIRCDDTADNGCDVIVRAATGYTPVAADQGKYLYAYRYYDNSSGVKTMGKTAVIGPVAAATTP